MKHSYLTAGAVSLMALFVLPGLAQIQSEDAPEFFFTRLVYSNGRGPAQVPELDFRCKDLAPGEGGTRMGGGWGTDFPASDCKFMWGVQRMSNTRVYDKTPHLVTAMDADLFKYPYLYIVSPHRMNLSPEEAENLREYLLRGGFLHIDDYWGIDQRLIVESEMLKIFPEGKIDRLDTRHAVFHTFFDIDSIVQIPNINNGRAVNRGLAGARTWEQQSETDPMIFGISNDKGHLMVLMTYNSDLGDAWEWMDDPEYPQLFTGHAYRMGLNFILYAMTH